MKRFGYFVFFALAVSLSLSACMSSRSSASRGCKVNAGMVGYR